MLMRHTKLKHGASETLLLLKINLLSTWEFSLKAKSNLNTPEPNNILDCPSFFVECIPKKKNRILLLKIIYTDDERRQPKRDKIFHHSLQSSQTQSHLFRLRIYWAMESKTYKCTYLPCLTIFWTHCLNPTNSRKVWCADWTWTEHIKIPFVSLAH